MTRARLTQEDLSDLIGLVYDSALEEVQWQSLIDRLAALFPGTSAGVFGHDGTQIHPAYTVSKGPGFLHDAPFDVGTSALPRANQDMLGAPNGYVARSTKYYSPEGWRQTRFYRDVAGPAGFEHVIYLKLDSDRRRGAMIGFALPADPTRHDRLHDPLFETLKLLSPHAVRAFRMARALTLARQATRTFGGFLDAIVLPMLVVDDHGTFVFGNAAGRRMLDRGDAVSLTEGDALRLAEPEDTGALHAKIREMARDGAPGGLRIVTDDAPLLLSIMPFRASLSEASALDRYLLTEKRLFAIFVGQTSQDAVSATLLKDVFDLTPREAQVCRALLHGQNAAEIAEQSRRSLKTVRNQIQSVYDKVGVTSNVALMDALSVFRTVGTLFEEEAPTGSRRPPIAPSP